MSTAPLTEVTALEFRPLARALDWPADDIAGAITAARGGTLYTPTREALVLRTAGGALQTTVRVPGSVACAAAANRATADLPRYLPLPPRADLPTCDQLFRRNGKSLPAAPAPAIDTPKSEVASFAAPRSTPINELDVVVLDTETTGLSPDKHQVIELAALRLRADLRTKVEGIDVRIRLMPGVHVDAGALKVNGYNPHSREWIAAALEMRDALEQLRAKVLFGEFVLCGQNIQFDRRFIDASYRRAGLALPSFGRAEVCTKKLAQQLLVARGLTRDARLATICDHFGISNDGAHGARVDVIRTVKALRKLRALEAGDGGAAREARTG